MKKHLYLKKRGEIWGFRQRVPKDLVDIIGKREIWRSLKTRDRYIAQKRYPKILAEVEQEFEHAKAQSETGQPRSLTAVDTDWVARRWFRKELQKMIDHDTQQFNTIEEKQEYIQTLGTELAILQSGEFPNYAQNLQSSVDQILIAEGYPSLPENLVKRRSQKNIAHVNKSDPKSHRLVELVRKGRVEILEQELVRLDEQIPRTKTIKLFKDDNSRIDKFIYPENKGITLERLIEEYFEQHSITRDPKTQNDKKAAFKFLTDIVGLKRQVTSLNRADFKKVKKLLDQYPTCLTSALVSQI